MIWGTYERISCRNFDLVGRLLIIFPGFNTTMLRPITHRRCHSDSWSQSAGDLQGRSQPRQDEPVTSRSPVYEESLLGDTSVSGTLDREEGNHYRFGTWRARADVAASVLNHTGGSSSIPNVSRYMRMILSVHVDLFWYLEAARNIADWGPAS